MIFRFVHMLGYWRHRRYERCLSQTPAEAWTCRDELVLEFYRHLCYQEKPGKSLSGPRASVWTQLCVMRWTRTAAVICHRLQITHEPVKKDAGTLIPLKDLLNWFLISLCQTSTKCLTQKSNHKHFKLFFKIYFRIILRVVVVESTL